MITIVAFLARIHTPITTGHAQTTVRTPIVIVVVAIVAVFNASLNM
tara:strand:+ start:244 stop:381 length:138 start_codon:yes stop_codon:yes gene_type:complete